MRKLKPVSQMKMMMLFLAISSLLLGVTGCNRQNELEERRLALELREKELDAARREREAERQAQKEAAERLVKRLVAENYETIVKNNFIGGNSISYDIQSVDVDDGEIVAEVTLSWKGVFSGDYMECNGIWKVDAQRQWSFKITSTNSNLSNAMTTMGLVGAVIDQAGKH